MISEIFVRLKISSVIRTPEQISDVTGFQCDHSWRIGEKRGKTIIVEKTNGWVLNSKMPQNASLEAHIQELLGRLLVNADRIRALSENETVELSCVVYASTPPSLNFDKSVIQQVYQLGASLDIDLYITDGGNNQTSRHR
ncbi:MAG: DUF4279 domain-containing protein [Verrucomicrobium sp.]|jgi:hypothetical protein|nr:DUF4279 domain-containing protein [Verrucomicrobium sp.]